MSDYHIRADNLLPEIEATLYRDRKVANLTGATSVELIYRPKAGGTVITKTGSFVGAMTSGVVKYSWISGDTATVGDYEAYWRVTYAPSVYESFPNNGFFTFSITENL
jgi:hypothetical protein